MYRNLIATMSYKGVTNEMIADLLNVHRNTVYNKIHRGEFTFGEAYKVSETYFPEYKPSYLFKRVEEKAAS